MIYIYVCMYVYIHIYICIHLYIRLVYRSDQTTPIKNTSPLAKYLILLISHYAFPLCTIF